MGEIAVLMAAGLGTRMRPLTDKIPKPLIRVLGKPMIETIIEGLRYRGISEIYVVVGYKKEQFCYLTDKYRGVSLIENKEYQKKNNISSVFAVCDVLKTSDCFICEADLYIPDPTVFDTVLKHSCYYGKMVYGHSDDWIFDLDEQGRIICIKKGGDNTFNMVGVSYFKKNDAKMVSLAIQEKYRQLEHEQLFWDEVVNENLDRLNLFVHPVNAGQIIEIDSIAELEKIEKMYSNRK